jgi:hypothetical protein
VWGRPPAMYYKLVAGHMNRRPSPCRPGTPAEIHRARLLPATNCDDKVATQRRPGGVVFSRGMACVLRVPRQPLVCEYTSSWGPNDHPFPCVLGPGTNGSQRAKN